MHIHDIAVSAMEDKVALFHGKGKVSIATGNFQVNGGRHLDLAVVGTCSAFAMCPFIVDRSLDSMP